MNLSLSLKLLPIFFRCLAKLPLSHLFYIAKLLRCENPHYHSGKLYINTFFPPYPSKAFDRFLDSVIKRQRIPYSTYFAVTDKCSFKCPHCSYGLHKKGRLNTKQALDVIRQIKTIGTITIGFTGGEPLLRDDIVELVSSAGDETASIIFSTGHKLSKDLAEKFVNAGLGCMMIGLESDSPEEHDKIRTVNGSFNEAIKAIETSVNTGLYTAISTVATKNKIESGKIERLACLAVKLGVHEFRILEPLPTGNLFGKIDEILTEKHSRQLVEFHKQWNRKGKGPAICCFSHLESRQLFGCGAGFHHLFIDALGNVCPCDLTPLSFGNLLNESLADIWQDMNQYFQQPRCECLMKELVADFNRLEKELPLDTAKSTLLCNLHKHNGKLPKIYENLFRGQK